MRTPAQIEVIIKEHITNRIDDKAKKSQFYGKLLQWKSNGVWHLGIGLSDNYIFDTGQNWISFNRNDLAKNVQVKLVNDVDAFPPDQVIERLSDALSCFRTYEYGVLGWNCEHLARLVATGDPICYQVKETIVPFISALNHYGVHPEARQLFDNYLETKRNNQPNPSITLSMN